MKICQVVPSLQEQHGGPSKSVRALARALARAGHEVELLATAPDAPKNGTDEQDPTVPLRVRIFHRDNERLCTSSGLRAALHESRADVFHHHALWLRTLHYAHRRARQAATPLIVSPRGMMSEWAWRHHRWRKAIAQHLVHPSAFAAAAGWHVTSPAEEAEVRALGFAQPVCVAPNGVDAPLPSELAAAAAHWHQICPETQSRPTALFYGRFHQKKRIIELIDVWLESAPAHWLLLLVGLPEDYTPEMLEGYAQKMSAGGRVRAFPGGGQPAPYAVASLFVLPSHNENFGLTVAEAMAHGVPVVVTDSTPWHDINAQGLGWCVAWESYGQAIHQAASETQDQLRDRGGRARTWVLREYSWDGAAARLGNFYAQCRSAAK